MDGEVIRFDGDRLLVTFAYRGFPSGASGRLAVESLQMEVYEVLSWRSELGRHVREINASIRSQGVATTSITIRASDKKQQQQILKILEKAMQMIDRADQIRDDLIGQYGDAPFSLDSIEVNLGEVFFYPSRKEIPAVLDLDFENEIYALMIGNGIRLNHQSLQVLYFSIYRLSNYVDRFANVPDDYNRFIASLAERLRIEEENDGEIEVPDDEIPLEEDEAGVEEIVR